MRNDSFSLPRKGYCQVSPRKGWSWVAGTGRGLLWMAVLVAVLSAGIASCQRPVTVAPNLRTLDQHPPYTYSDQDWALVLREYVYDGLVSYTKLAAAREPLDRYYALLGVTGPSRTPDQFPSAANVTAYWINAYNAAVILFVLQHFPTETIYDESMPKIDLASFRIDGGAYTLPQIESKILEASGGDVRALFAMGRGALGTPRLSSEPMRATTLERQLADAAAEALNNPRILRIDHQARRILVWQLVLARKDDFERYYCTRRRTPSAHLLSVLMDMASPDRRRALQTAVGYAFQTLPFSRPLNNWTPESPDMGRPSVP
jgi:hypothetical protein